VAQKILRRPDVERATGLPRSTIYQRMAEGTFPKPVPLGGRSVGWIEAEIADWQNHRQAERDNKRGQSRGQRRHQAK
jgi:prophage regulatory protein